MDNNIKIVSLNCRGLRDLNKRKDVLNNLRDLKANIYCLQDTHFTEADTDTVRVQWGYECIISGNRTDARGVAMLFNSNFEYRISEQKIDKDGNYIIVGIELEKKLKVVVVTIYGTNRDDPGFYQAISEHVSNMEFDQVIMCADWNLVQDYDLDRCNYVQRNNPSAQKTVLNMKQTLGLVDPWRVYNPQLRRYTWSRKTPVKKARLDFFLITEELMTIVDKVDILPGYRTDHALVVLELRMSNFQKGKGFWKFNNSLLKDSEYVQKVKDCIQKVKEEYAVPIYRQDALHDVKADLIQFTIDDQLFLETLLLKIRGLTIQYAAAKKRFKGEKKRALERKLKLCQELADEMHGHNRVINELMENLNTELEEFRAEYMRGLLVRSKAKWMEDGEKPSKYFCALEKRNYINKNITKLIDGTGSNIVDQADILQEVKSFYVNLYSSKEDSLIDVDLLDLLSDIDVKKLKECEREELSKPLNLEEISLSLKKMKNEKSPGPDGYTAEFFKFFWCDLKHYLHRSYTCGMKTGSLSITQKQGVISIIPKGDKPRELLKNWRPISLLNVSYKILSGTIANRIKTVLNGIIHEDQRGFLQGRFIGDNTRLLYDIMHYTEEHKTPGLLLLVDFEKAFDSISWRFITKCLDFFNFGSFMCDMVKLLYKDAQLCVIQHGVFSEFFSTVLVEVVDREILCHLIFSSCVWK